MKQPIVVCGVVSALMGSTGLAQPLRVDLVFDRTEVMVGETVEATLVATISAFEGSYFSSISANLIASDASLGLASTMSGLDWGMPALGAIQTGTPSGASLMGIFAAQYSLFGPVDFSNPFVIGRFTVETTGVGQLTYSVTRANAAPGVFSFSSDNCGPFDCGGYSESFTSQTVMIRPVPAPASVGLGLAMMSLATRRRSRA
jgi:hypothetical protein